nr:helix-hairpin-helix domain-containing protein [Rhabdothermincola salaria]
MAFTSTSAAAAAEETPPAGSGSPSTAPTALVVHAAGAVHQPGVHRLEPGARVADVVAAAGGATPDADLDRVNLAAPVADGERLYVPRLGQPDPPLVAGSGGGPSGGSASGPGASEGGTGPIDVNAATVAELDALPGVGPATAEAIVAHRETNGPFRRVEDLLGVRGIGPSKLDGLRDHVVIG